MSMIASLHFALLMSVLCVNACSARKWSATTNSRRILSKGDASHPERPMEYTDRWAVVLKPGHDSPDEIATMHGFENVGEMSALAGHFHFIHACNGRKHMHRVDDRGCLSRSKPAHEHTKKLASHGQVIHAEQQTRLHRKRRAAVEPQDPLWDRQWYMTSDLSQHSIGVRSVWNSGLNGSGIVVTIVDDGMKHDHPDLVENYLPSASYDVNGGDNDPYPDLKNSINKHGTRCSGEVGAALNSVCGVGVAYGSRIGAIRMLDGDVTDSVEAESLSYARDVIDIYTSSWGPNDDGRTIEGPGERTQQVLVDGITYGRGGKGSIYLFASGNGGSYGDSCNCDGYCNSIYTLAIGAISQSNGKPHYTEPCSATMGVTYSSGGFNDGQIVTTDPFSTCTERFSGTSAAAPLAAGMFALVLQANPMLTWRDLQHIVVQTAAIVSPTDDGWHRNFAGHYFNLKFGFGKLVTSAMVTAAQSWTNVGAQITTEFLNGGTFMTAGNEIVQRSIIVNPNATTITRLEHVQIHVFATCIKRGSLVLDVVCPSGTRSNILSHRSRDGQTTNLDWTFMTVECWNESPIGAFRLLAHVEDSTASANIIAWGITIFGTGNEFPLTTNPNPTIDDYNDACASCHFDFDIDYDKAYTGFGSSFGIDSAKMAGIVIGSIGAVLLIAAVGTFFGCSRICRKEGAYYSDLNSRFVIDDMSESGDEDFDRELDDILSGTNGNTNVDEAQLEVFEGLKQALSTATNPVQDYNEGDFVVANSEAIVSIVPSGSSDEPTAQKDIQSTMDSLLDAISSDAPLSMPQHDEFDDDDFDIMSAPSVTI